MNTDSKRKQNKQCSIPVVERSVITYKQFKEALNIVNLYKTQLGSHYNCVINVNEVESISKYCNVTKETLLDDIDLSPRLKNVLRFNSDKLSINIIKSNTTIKELEGLSISELQQCLGAGRKTLQEVMEVCFYAGVKLIP